MAIWQYTFHVLPNESIKSLLPLKHTSIREDLFDDESYWELYPSTKEKFILIHKFLPKNKSWCNEIDLYGAQDSNCFEVLSNDEGSIISASFRIDFRSNYENILRQIIEFCNINGLALLDEKLNFAPSDFAYLADIIENSPQAKRYFELM